MTSCTYRRHLVVAGYTGTIISNEACCLTLTASELPYWTVAAFFSLYTIDGARSYQAQQSQFCWYFEVIIFYLFVTAVVSHFFVAKACTYSLLVFKLLASTKAFA
jgi:hypothetical protein